MIQLHAFFSGVTYSLWYSRKHLLASYVLLPFGLLIIICVLYGLNKLVSDVFKIKFPASVLGMLINLVILITLQGIANLKTTHTGWRGQLGNVCSWSLEKYLTLVDPPMKFSLKWINVFFIPSFIILPLSDHITFVECAKIAAVFAVGGLSLMIVDVYMILFLKWALSVLGINAFNIEKIASFEKNGDEDELPEVGRLELNSLGLTNNSGRENITETDLPESSHSSLHSTRSNFLPNNPFSEPQEATRSNGGDIAPPLPAYISSSPHQSAESSRRSSDRINDTPTQQPKDAASQYDVMNLSGDSKSIAVFVSNYIDWLLYLALFLLSLPFFYIRSIHVMLPFHLGLTVISYYFALLIPVKFPKSKKFAHPILISTAIILFVCFISSLIYHGGSPDGFLNDLRFYKTGKNYSNLFTGKKLYDNGKVVPPSIIKSKFTSEPEWPGCGDILSSLMDISIVSLSLPMFTHRKDFINNFWVLIPPLLISMALTFFCYPVVCYNIGISPQRSIGFIGRSVTLALGTPLINSLEGSVSLMAVCTILSGICGVLIGDTFFRILRVPSNDFVTRGVTLGINCGAIATAHLLNIDPRAASMSSLSFSLFGTIMIVLASVGAIRDLIQNWVGLN